MSLASFYNGHHHVNSENNPNNRDCDINRPLQLSIFLRRCKSKGKTDRCSHNNELPPPEINFGEFIAPHPRFEQALKRIINPCKDSISYKGKNHRIGMQWSYSSKSSVWNTT